MKRVSHEFLRRFRDRQATKRTPIVASARVFAATKIYKSQPANDLRGGQKTPPDKTRKTSSPSTYCRPSFQDHATNRITDRTTRATQTRRQGARLLQNTYSLTNLLIDSLRKPTVGVTELESVTSCMSSKRSNQLSYTPEVKNAIPFQNGDLSPRRPL